MSGLEAPDQVGMAQRQFNVVLSMQHWHERYGRDPAASWLRGVIGELFRA